MTENFWCVKDGKVGTAHQNREGDTVDFRPAEEMKAVLKVNEAGAFIHLPPAKGVEAKSLKITAVEVQRTVIQDEISRTLYRVEWRAEFEGVAFTLSNEQWVEKHTPEAEAFRAEAERKRKEEKFRQEIFCNEMFYSLNAEEFARISRPSSREWGHLTGSANWQQYFAELESRVWKHVLTLPVPTDYRRKEGSRPYYPDWAKKMRQDLIKVREAEKAKRKAEYLGRKENHK